MAPRSIDPEDEGPGSSTVILTESAGFPLNFTLCCNCCSVCDVCDPLLADAGAPADDLEAAAVDVDVLVADVAGVAWELGVDVEGSGFGAGFFVSRGKVGSSGTSLISCTIGFLSTLHPTHNNIQSQVKSSLSPGQGK